MKGCPACEQVAPLDEAFETIFDALEAAGLEDSEQWTNLAFIRLDLHSRAKDEY
jgi:hypothetical protein